MYSSTSSRVTARSSTATSVLFADQRVLWYDRDVVGIKDNRVVIPGNLPRCRRLQETPYTFATTNEKR